MYFWRKNGTRTKKKFRQIVLFLRICKYYLLNILVTIDSVKAIKTGDISEGKWRYEDLEGIMVFENTASVL